MAFEAATDRLIAILVATPEASYARRGHLGQFKHDTNFHPDLPETFPKRARSFGLLPVTWATSLHSRSEATRHALDDLVIAVAYPDERDWRRHYLAIRADYDLIRGRLLNEANWDRPASGIVQVVSGGAEGLAATVDTSERGSILRIEVALRHTEQVTT